MRSVVEIETGKPGQMEQVLSQSLEDTGSVEQEVSTRKGSIKVEVKTESLGQLRGCTDTVFRLGTLSKKILER